MRIHLYTRPCGFAGTTRHLRTGQWPPLPLPLGVSMDDILFLQQQKYWPVPSKESINELHCSKRRNFVGYSDLAVEENHVSAAIHHEGPHEDIVNESAAAASCSLPEDSHSINQEEEPPTQSLASLESTTAASSPSTINEEPQPLVFLEEDLTTTSTLREKDKQEDEIGGEESTDSREEPALPPQAPKRVKKLRRSKKIAALKRKRQENLHPFFAYEYDVKRSIP